ncbi:MAG: flagellar type III secretion system pore protein FliP [Fibrobacteres bacterium]|nr:flagellar type III secretion system pore protein FliP [Fibrobacterota bacterium]
MKTKLRSLIPLLGLFVLVMSADLHPQILPKVSIGFDQSKAPEDAAVTLEIIFLITILTLAPSILMMMTAFTRIVIVLSFVRRALGTQTLPSNQIVIGLSLFLTLFVMMPVLTQMNEKAFQPYLAEKIDYKTALKEAMNPVRGFMLRYVSEKDVALFVRISKSPLPRTPEDLSNVVLIPAFIISELKTAFIIGFLIYIPFLVIDMVVASLLMSMGMMMLPPMMVSLPLKLILFVLVDGWHLIVKQLMYSFN